MKLTTARDMVAARCGGYCDHCGWPLGARWELHHRYPGRMGGSSRDRDVPSNLLALIPDHHNMHPNSVHMRSAASRAAGWIISSHDQRPFPEVPVLLWGRTPALLDDQGGWSAV